jgi:hypothetical protein
MKQFLSGEECLVENRKGREDHFFMNHPSMKLLALPCWTGFDESKWTEGVIFICNKFGAIRQK